MVHKHTLSQKEKFITKPLRAIYSNLKRARISTKLRTKEFWENSVNSLKLIITLYLSFCSAKVMKIKRLFFVTPSRTTANNGRDDVIIWLEVLIVQILVIIYEHFFLTREERSLKHRVMNQVPTTFLRNVPHLNHIERMQDGAS